MQYRLTLFNPQTGQQSETLVQLAEGETEVLLRGRYQQQALVLLRMEPVKTRGIRRGERALALTFCQEMGVLLDSGLNVVGAIDTLASRTDRSTLTQVYQQLRQALQGGRSLSTAMRDFPQVFPVFLVASIQASEQSGNLVAVLERFVVYQEKLDELRGRLVSAALYPAIVLGVSLLVILFLVGYVIPRFSVIFGDMVDQLPLLTQWLLQFGLLISGHPLTSALLLLSGLVLLVLAIKQPAIRRYGLNWFCQRRLVRENLVQYSLSRLYRTLAMLLDAGIPFVTALQMCRGVLGEHLSSQFEQAQRQIESGQNISVSFESQQLTDNITSRILQAGERSGEVAQSFHNMARFIEQKLTYRVDRLARVLEPVIMLLVGGLIGLIVVLMYSPIFELANTIQ